MLVKDLMKYVCSNIKKFNLDEIEIRIYEYGDNNGAIFKFESQIKEEINLQIPQNFLIREVMHFSTTFYLNISLLTVLISTKEVFL